MALSLGIVGLPNVGKSTLFQALTKKEVEIANYPFTTIDPNVGVVQVPDERLEKLAHLFHSEKVIPSIIEFVDIAGLVKGANKGEGLGNQFLARIREVDAICQVVRCFPSADIINVEKTVDPLRDIDTINTELELKDIETDKKGSSIPESELLSKKPVLYLLNCNPGDASEELLKQVKKSGAAYVTANLKDELEMQELAEVERKELGFVSQLPELIKKSYELLDLITFFTVVGEKEARAWAVKKGTKAPQAGGVVHGDFQEKFIKAMVIPWDKLLEVGTYAAAAAKGWLRTEGKDYVVQDGDVIEIKHG
ncbi:redox-regulated ATPase YchF [Patescibacteria group bacterium]|nr:redox-regulated ATPase YchF [Patescibacteria group bacterium]